MQKLPPHTIAPSTAKPRMALRSLPALLGLCLAGSLAACQAETPAAPATADATAPATAPADDAAAATAAATPELSAEQLQAIVTGLLRKGYGENAFDAASGCWKHSFETSNDELDYCMKPGTPEVVVTPSGRQVYLQTHSDPKAGTYALVDPGLRGLFAASVSASGEWQPLAQSPAIDQGQAGDCGCADAKLQQVGPERFGWLSTSGGTWQGVTVSHYDLYVPVGASFQNVSRIARSTESAPGETVDIAIDNTGTPVDGMFPIKATRSGGKNPGTSLIAFDPGQKLYPWPQ